jgi:hypothetical protein
VKIALAFATVLCAFLLSAASVRADKIPVRSAGNYGTILGSPTALGSDLSQLEWDCDPTSTPCPSTQGFELIVGLTSPVPSGTVFTLDLPSSFDGTWGAFSCATSSVQNNFGFSLCATSTSSACANALTASMTNPDVFTLIATASCTDPTFLFDLNSGGGNQLASLGGNTATTPEPESLVLIIMGVLSLGLWSRKRLIA